MNIPDHPDIDRALRYGYPYGEEDEKMPICPVCGKEAEEFYIDESKDILGCNNCIRRIDSWKLEACI